ncbi:hypothetical protein BZA77DRAFT_360460 [Pyronema omphalodes]|nr:hypothetical protein BZA77DRAFT_360460 [Pyronema omphalodes]
MDSNNTVNCMDADLHLSPAEGPSDSILLPGVSPVAVMSVDAVTVPRAGHAVSPTAAISPPPSIPPETAEVASSIVGSETIASEAVASSRPIAPSVSAASTSGSVVSPAFLESTLTDYYRIISPAPAHGLPIVSPDEEQRLITNLSLPSSLQRDIAIRPFAYMAALPTAAEVVEICEVPEALYGRLKLEMYPIEVQRRAVMRMWRAFHWNWNNEADVRKFVSKELGKRYNQSKRAADKRLAKLVPRTVDDGAAITSDASAAGLPTTNMQPVETLAASLPTDASASLANTTNLLPDHESPPALADSSASLCSGPLSAAATPASAASSASSAPIPAITCPRTGWVVPDVHLARAFMGDDYWSIVDTVISEGRLGAFRTWDEPVPAVAVHLQDWMYKTGFIDYEDVMLLGSDDEH